MAADSSLDQSLLNFFTQIVAPRSAKKGLWLEVGCGAYPIFSNVLVDGPELMALDCDAKLIEQALRRYPKLSLVCTPIQSFCPPSGPLELIFDAHCLHTLVDQSERRNYWQWVSEHLSSGGVVAIEHAVLSKRGMAYSHRHVPHALELEEEVLNAGLSIEYLRVDASYKFIFEPGREGPSPDDPDRLRLLAKKRPSLS